AFLNRKSGNGRRRNVGLPFFFRRARRQRRKRRTKRSHVWKYNRLSVNGALDNRSGRWRRTRLPQRLHKTSNPFLVCIHRVRARLINTRLWWRRLPLPSFASVPRQQPKKSGYGNEKDEQKAIQVHGNHSHFSFNNVDGLAYSENN